MHRPVLLGLALISALACRPAPEPPPGIRNVVLISIDALGAKHVSAYGYPRRTTPRLDREAMQGTLFMNATTNQVWTLTSHLTMLTGLYPQAHGASEKQPAVAGATSLAQILRDEGFRTAAFVGAGGYMRPDFGLGRGFERYVLGKQKAELDNRPRIAWIQQQAVLRRQDPLHRFFLFAHYYDVHSDEGTSVPYAAPAPHGLRFLDGELDWERRGDTALLIELQKSGPVSQRDREVLSALYDGGVYYTDQFALAPLLDA
jgi:arylsulfatase A-like enzyme